MTRPARRRRPHRAGVAAALLALAAPVVGLVVGPGPPAAAAPRAAQAAAAKDPLRVTIDTLSPSTVPTRPSARVTVTGRVVNRSEEAWSDLQVFLVRSREPVRSVRRLRATAAGPADAVLGDRLVGAGLYDEVPDLAPGESTRYSVTVRRSDLGISGREGVYWLGVHVLGESPDGRQDGADGRARTFWPLVRSTTRVTSMALALQLRGAVDRAGDGTLADPGAWRRQVRDGGRLGRVLGLARTARGFPLTWVVDPAVLDAVRSVARGNPGLDLAPTLTADGSDGGSDGDPSPSSDPAATTDTAAQEDPVPGGRDATRWLRRATRSLDSHPLLTVPYGDLDVTSALRRGYGDLLARADRLSADATTRYALDASPVVAPSDGLAPGAVLGLLDPTTPVLLRGAAVRGDHGPRVDLSTGQRLVLDEAGLASAPAGPTEPARLLALRQRIVADAALHALGPDADQPLVVALPPRFDPGPRWPSSRFFAGLTRPWLGTLDLRQVAGAVAGSPPLRADSPRIDYPTSALGAELPAADHVATAAMLEVGDALAGLLTLNDDVDDQVARTALLTSSVWARATPLVSAGRAEEGADHVRQLLDQVGIRSQSFVTMSSETGSFQVTLVNGLEQPVTVGLRAVVADGALRVTPPDPVQLPPGQRRTVRVDARATDIGVHRVTLEAVNTDGVPLGAESRFTVRSSKVGLVIWVVMGVGAVTLFGAIALRVLRRVRRRRATHGPILGGRA